MRLEYLAIVACLLAPQAWADCTAPAAPTRTAQLVKPVAPTYPTCYDPKIKMNTCDGPEVGKFNDASAKYNLAAKAYARDVQTYIERLNAYVAAAEAFAKCEARTVTD